MMNLKQLYHKFSGVKLSGRNTLVRAYQDEQSCRYVEISPGWVLPIPKGVYLSQRAEVSTWSLQAQMDIQGKKSWSPKTVGDLLEALGDLHPRIVDAEWGGNTLHELCAYSDIHQMWDHCTQGDQLFLTYRTYMRHGVGRLRILEINDRLWIPVAPGLEMYSKPSPNGKLYLSIHVESTGVEYMVGQLRHLEEVLKDLGVDPLYRVYRSEVEMLAVLGISLEAGEVTLDGPRPTTVEFEVLGAGTSNRELRFTDGVRIPIPRCVSVTRNVRDGVMAVSAHLRGRHKNIARVVRNPKDFYRYYKEVCSYVKTVDGELRVGASLVNRLEFTREVK